jgi:hypothetical protein
VEEEVVEFVFHRKERHFGKVQKISTTIRKKCFFPSLTSYFVCLFFLMKSTSTYVTTINRLITFLVYRNLKSRNLLVTKSRLLQLCFPETLTH